MNERARREHQRKLEDAAQRERRMKGVLACAVILVVGTSLALWLARTAGQQLNHSAESIGSALKR